MKTRLNAGGFLRWYGWLSLIVKNLTKQVKQVRIRNIRQQGVYYGKYR